MKKVFSKLMLISITTALAVTGCSKDDNNDYAYTPPTPGVNAVVIESTGDGEGILGKLTEFRALAGNPLNTTPGVTGGRREVNWDAVPANFTNNGNFPFDFFGSADPTAANGRKRGLILGTPGNGFRVDSTDFSAIEASYADQFETFSKKRLFIANGSNITEVSFRVPGTDIPASVKSFAVIFSDVDNTGTTTVQYFSGNKSLGKYTAKANAQGFSFLGVGFTSEKITKVKIVSGTAALATGIKDVSNGGTNDLVVMDDFLYDEPVPFN